MPLSDDRFLQAAIFIIIPAVILLGSLMMEASICIAMVMMVWMIAGVLLYYVPQTKSRDERS